MDLTDEKYWDKPVSSVQGVNSVICCPWTFDAEGMTEMK